MNSILNTAKTRNTNDYHRPPKVRCSSYNISADLVRTTKLSINLSIYEFGPNDVEIEEVLYMEIQILNQHEH
jgi:hypothetical protein